MTEVAAGSKEAIFVGLLRARGVTRQKSPGLGDTLAAGVGACREVVLGPPRSCCTSREAEARGPVLRACPGQAGTKPACTVGQSGVSEQCRSVQSRRARGI